MRKYKPHFCKMMKYYLGLGRVGIRYIPKFLEYGIPYLGSKSMIRIDYCPWCGKKLPPPLREKWDSALEKMGIDYAEDGIPKEFQSEAWYLNPSKVKRNSKNIKRTRITPAKKNK